MKLPDWQDLVLEPRVLPEPTTNQDRLVLWIQGERDAMFQYWERLSNAPRAAITSESGLLATAATSIPTRQDLRGLMGRLLGFSWLRDGDRRSFALPNGRPVAQCGPRASDLLLVWTEGRGLELSPDEISARWPDAKEPRRLGRNLFVVAKQPVKTAGAPGAEEPAPIPGGAPREQATANLDLARFAGDRRGEATALADLGVIGLNESKPQAALEALQAALPIMRELSDPDGEHDVLGNLGMALLALRDPRQAWTLFERQLAYARSKNDRFGEKLALERLGLASWSVGDPGRALEFYERALAGARAVGDRAQESSLLWQQAIQLAEMGRRDQAIERGEAAIGILKKMGRPQAAWYGSVLQKYRIEEVGGFAAAESAAGPDPRAYAGTAMVSSAPAGGPAAPAASDQGPGLLRMAMSATKAMAGFVGGGFQIASPAAQAARQKVCSTCEHHTGLRCKICGCFTTLKSRMVHEDCPIGKWPSAS